MDAEPALVLISDHDTAARMHLRVQLQLAGFRVVEAEDGYRAFVLALGHRPDLVVTELNTSGLDGYGLIRRLRATDSARRLPIVVLSSRAATEDRIAALAVGANDFIAKPCDSGELAMKLWGMIHLHRADAVVALPSRHSCFISYCDADSRFVDRLHRDFLLASIKCWKWTGDARVGAGLWNEIERAMRAHDKIVLVASRNSLNSAPVNREIEIALKIERESQRDVLTPVTLDDYLFAEWQGVHQPLLLSKMIADARGWEENPARYDDARERLIGSLAIQANPGDGRG